MRFPIIFVSGLLGLFGWHCVEVPPLKLHVVDSEIGHPIPGLVVYYTLVTAQPRMFFGYAFEPTKYRKRIYADCETDNHGQVKVPSARLWLRRYEMVLEEWVYVNLAVEGAKVDRINKTAAEGCFSNGLSPVYTPNKEYTGAIITVDWDCRGEKEEIAHESVKGIPVVVITRCHRTIGRDEPILVRLAKVGQ